jgi:DNA-binding beta-propeller fold protein YncE/tetratricopeptide (TPR) repeat protein
MKRIAVFIGAAIFLAVRAQAYDTVHFQEPIKVDGLVRPVAGASSGDRLYVVDGKKAQLFILDAAGKLLKTVGGPGSAAGQFRGPRGVAIGPSGDVFVADAGNNRVQIFDRDGKFLDAFGESGSEPGHLSGPQSVAVGADGRIFVADTGNDRVQVFTRQGILLFVLGSSGKLVGQFKSPTRVSVDPSDDLYVLDDGNDRVQKFDETAKFVKSYGLAGGDVAIDAYGFLYSLDGRHGKVIEQFNGELLGRVGSDGSGPGQFRRAEGLSVAPDGTLIVFDTGNDRIQRLELANKLKTSPLPLGTRTKMSVSGPSSSWSYAATQLAAYGDSLYAYLPEGGPFVRVGLDGKQKAAFGSAKGKTGDVTRGAGGIGASAKMGLLVSDTPDSRLQRFTLDGKWQSNVGEAEGFFDSKSKEGRVRQPNGVAINDDGTMYAADTGNQRIDAFSPDGVFLFAVGPKVGTYLLKEPVAVAWDKAGFLYFVDKGLKRVFKCEPSGALLATWGEEGEGPGQFEAPVSIAFDGESYLYTLDQKLKRVSVYTRDGQWLTDFFAGGKQERELQDPVAVTILDHKLFIADQGKSRIVAYDLHPQLGAPVDVSSSTKEGVVSLAWQEVSDPWTDGYQVFRASVAGGAFAPIGSPKEARFLDSDVTPDTRYWYRVATAAKTRDVGPWSRPVETFVTASINRAPVEISTVTLGDIFAAKYKWYLRNPIGSVSVTNNLNVPFLNVKVTFKLKDYMDFGFDTEIKKLEPKQTVQIPLIATLNNKVLEVTEDTPIQAEFSLNYFERGESRTASLTKPLRLYSRNAITWDDTRKIANFITFKDEPIKNLKPAVTADFKNRKAVALNPSVVKAMRAWNALAESGVKFAANPANPFETAHDDPNFPVDYTQYPRETLKRKTGQCSDLTSLYAALLTDNEVRVALLDYPGHITLMFDTEADDALEAGLPADLLVPYDGTMWVPVEVTYVGKPFTEAVSKAAYAYKAEAEKGRVKVVDVNKAFEEYEPVTMPPADAAAAPLDAAALEKRYDDQVGALAKERYQLLKKSYEDQLAQNPQDATARLEMGIAEYQYGNDEAAVADFDKVLATEPKNAAALNNIGSVAFLKGDYAAAEKRFRQAAEADAQDASVWLNLVKTAVKLQNADKAREYGARAVALAPSYKPFVDDMIKKL